VDDLLTTWSLSNPVPLDSKHQIDAILPVAAVAIHPVIIIYKNGEIEGNEDLDNFTSPGLFPYFVVHPKKFHEFIFQHWDAPCSSLLVDQLHQLTTELARCAVHVVRATNGKGNNQTVKHLREIIRRLKQIADRPSPTTRRRCDIMEWMEVTWSHIEPTLREIAQKKDLLN
jgi:hypothetical protein